MVDTVERTETALQMVPLPQLLFSEDDQTRTQPRNEKHIADLVESLRDMPSEQWPPLLVTPWGESEPDAYAVLGGEHRLEAARRLKLRALPCRVIPNGDWEAGFADNLNHGLKLSRDDAKRHAFRLKERYPDMGEREIARRCHVSHTTVQRWFRPAEQTSVEEEALPSRRANLVSQHVRGIVKLEKVGAGSGFFGRDISAREVQAAIKEYPKEERPAIAAILRKWARAFETGAAEYMTK